MGMKSSHCFKRRRITLAQQQAAIMGAFPESKAIIKKSILVWNGKLKPTPLSKEYKVTIKYNGISTPEAWVFGDELAQLEAHDFPHKYQINIEEKRVKMCLFMPRSNEWNTSKLISDTIVPWAIEWLYYYEIWLVTGEWCGGGIQ